MEQLRRTWSAFKFRKAAIFAVVVLALVGAWEAFGWYWTYEQRHVETQAEAAANAGRVHGPWSDYDLICFSNYTGHETLDFAVAARRAGKNLLNQCLSPTTLSDTMGVIGFIGGGNIRCTVVDFKYVLEEARPSCIPPQRLSVTKQTFKTHARIMPGRIWSSEPGEFYYSIREVER